MTYREYLAQKAYEAYFAAHGGFKQEGPRMKPWEGLSIRDRLAWIDVAEAIQEEIRDSEKD